MKFKGVFLGSGASRKICMGFVPDFVRIRNLQDAFPSLEWAEGMAGVTGVAEGIKFVVGTTYIAPAGCAFGAGVRRYYGGDVAASAAATALVPADGVALYAGDQRAKGVSGTIGTWTLDTPGTPSGHFERPIDTTYVNVGSRVLIAGRWYAITAVANDGDAANDITLSEAAPSGPVEKILYMYDLVPAPANTMLPAGILLSDTAVNVSGKLCLLEAGTYGDV